MLLVLFIVLAQGSPAHGTWRDEAQAGALAFRFRVLRCRLQALGFRVKGKCFGVRFEEG